MHYKNMHPSLNFRDDEKRVLDEAIRLKSYLGANLSVVHINDPGAGKPHMLMDTLPMVRKRDIVDQESDHTFSVSVRCRVTVPELGEVSS